MDNSQNKSLVRVVDDLSSVNDDKIKSLLSALNTRGLQGVDCIPWVFNIQGYYSGDFLGQTNDLDCYEVFSDEDEFNIPLVGCIKVSQSVVIPSGFATSLSWSVQLNYPAPLVSPSPVVFTTLVGITDQTSLDAWYVDFLAACGLAGVDTSIWFGDPDGFGPSYIPLSPDEFTFFLFSPGFSFEITAVVEAENVSIVLNVEAGCRYTVTAPALYPGRKENLYIGRLTVSFPSTVIGEQDNYQVLSIRDYVLFNKGLVKSIGGFSVTPEVFRFYSDYSEPGQVNEGSSCFVLENVVFSRVAFILDQISFDSDAMFVNFSGYKISNVP